MTWQAKLVRKAKELRFVVSPVNKSQKGVYGFLNSNLAGIRALDSSFPLVVRECEGIDDFMLMRFDYGVEKREDITGLSEKEIEALVSKYASEADKINKTLQ